ncbi:MAG: hypothetical protein KAJ73_02225 [Zetaproteobacteria bacterium]|nr:hypothetical protein [Zetaproteobacteria bacterium]
MNETILIHLKNGNIENVENLPEGCHYRVLDWDTDEPLHPNAALYLINWLIKQNGDSVLTIGQITKIINRVHPSYFS